MMWSKQRKKGETLIEVLVSLFCLALGSGAAAALIISALQTNAFTKDNLIALNLAREGVEAVRSIRDTNWLKWSYDKDTCWNLIDDSKCDKTTAKKIPEGFYRVGMDLGVTPGAADFKWKLQPEAGISDLAKVLDLERGESDQYNEFFNLHILDRYPGVNSDGIGLLNDDQDLYGHVKVDAWLTEDGTAGDDLGTSRFHRMIFVEYEDADPTNDEMKVYSIIQWISRGKVKQVEMVTTLTNYQKYL